MTTQILGRPSNGKILALLAAVCVAQVLAVAWYVSYFFDNGYLPTPFIYDKYDTFMDFFHPMFWSDQDGRYTEWGSVYPPLNFLFLKLVRVLLIGQQLFAYPFSLRQEGAAAQLFLVAMYVIVPAFVVTRPYWHRFSVLEKTLFYIAAVSSTPLLFALERGNLVIFSLLLLPFLFARAPVSRLMSLAFLINLKPYFALLFLVYLIKGRWNELIVGFGLTAMLYLVTGLMLGSDPFAVPMNLLGFAQHEGLFSLREITAMPSSVSAFSYLLSAPAFQGSRFGGLPVDAAVVSTTIESTKWAVQAFAVVAMVKMRNRLSIQHISAMLLVMISNLGVSVGGYTLIYYIALIPLFMGMRLRWLYLASLALMSLPLDYIGWAYEDIGPQFSYLSNHIVEVQWVNGIGSPLRPVVNLMLLAAMAWEFMMMRPKGAIVPAEGELSSPPTSLPTGS